MAATVLHILWRRLKYGAWLPNTYYAKYVAAWPESGKRYVVSFLFSREDLMVPRAIGAKTLAVGFPIWQGVAVGYPGWVMPNVAVLDLVGLNDWVIARAPVSTARERTMAHDRSAPPGYVACLQPNVTIDRTSVHVAPRATPLTAETMKVCEQAFRPQKR